MWSPWQGFYWPHGHKLNKLGRGLLGECKIPNIKALGIMALDKKICLCFPNKQM